MFILEGIFVFGCMYGSYIHITDTTVAILHELEHRSMNLQREKERERQRETERERQRERETERERQRERQREREQQISLCNKDNLN